MVIGKGFLYIQYIFILTKHILKSKNVCIIFSFNFILFLKETPAFK